MQAGLVSIMMPAFNAEPYIRQAIESVLGQSYPHWELIVVNDGSTDRTAEVVSQFSGRRIKLIHQTNSGEAAARNTALAAMQGEFVAFLDADDVYLPCHLSATVRYLEGHPTFDGVYTDGHYCTETGTVIQSLSSRRIGPFEGRVYDKAVEASCVFGPPVCVVLRRDVIVRHELTFDRNIVIGPDWDFFIQYADVGQFGYVDQPTCLYRVHRTNISTQIGLQKRASELAKCRKKAIAMESFKRCAVETRFAVFYDLLVNLLRDDPEQQEGITQWPGFGCLPPDQQSRLLRLMAGKAMIRGGSYRYIDGWLRRSRELNPFDGRGAVLLAVYRLSPVLCKALLRVKRKSQVDSIDLPPFAELNRVQATERI